MHDLAQVAEPGPTEDRKEFKQAMRKIEHHTGVSSFQDVTSKMERHAEAMSKLTDM